MRITYTRDGTGGPGKDRTFYYGWVAAILGGALMFTVGNFQYVFGVFVLPLIDTFGWSRAAISLSVSIRNIVTAISSPIVGSLSDRLGVRKFMIGGIFLVGLSYLLVSWVSSLWQLYLILGVVTGLGLGMITVPNIATVGRWFGGTSALANGIVYTGISAAQMILPPLVTFVIIRYGWSTSFIVLAGLAWLGGGTVWYFFKVPPAEKPKRIVPNELDGAAEAVPGREDGNETVWTLSMALRTGTLWTLMVAYLAVALCFQIIMIHIVAAAVDVGITLAAAAVILTVSGATNTVGRLTVGTVAGRIGSKKVLVICLGMQAVLLFILMGAKTLPAFYIITACYALFYGCIPPIVPTITGEYFGTKSMGAIFGTTMFGYTFGAAVGPLAAGYIFDVTGRYYIAFLLGGIVMSLAFLNSLTLKPPVRKT